MLGTKWKTSFYIQYTYSSELKHLVYENNHDHFDVYPEQAQILTALVFYFYNLDCPPWEDEVI